MTMTATRSSAVSPMTVVHDTITNDQRALVSGVHVLRREQPLATVETMLSKRVAAYCRVSTDLEQQA
ncbi:MAG: hypothetical protein RR505_12670, partial [Raoultibacter sp.]